MKRAKNFLKSSILAAFTVVTVTPQLSANELFDKAGVIKSSRMSQSGNFIGSRDMLDDRYSNNLLSSVTKEELMFMKAKAAYLAADTDAEILLKEFIDNGYDSENRQQALLFLGNILLNRGELKNAEKYYSQINTKELYKRDREELYVNLAKINIKNGNYKKAADLLSDIISTNSEFRAEALFYKSCSDYALGDTKAAENGFSKLRNDAVFGNESLYYLTGIYFTSKRYSSTLSEGERLLNENVDKEKETELLRICGESAFITGETDKSVSFLKRYISAAANPEDKAIYMLGISCYKNGEYEEAVKYLGDIAENDKDLSQNAYLYLGHSYLAKGDKNGALLSYGKAAAADTDMKTKETAMYNYALLSNETSILPFEKATKIYETFLNLFPESKNAENINALLVDRYFTSKNYNAALTSVKKITKPSKALIRAKQLILYNLGAEALINGRKDEAEELFSQAIRNGEDNEITAKALLWRGEIKYDAKRYNEAEKDFSDHISKAASPDPISYYNIGYVRFKNKSYSGADGMFNLFIKKYNPNKNIKTLADAWNRIGDCKYMMQNYFGAQEAYQRSIDVYPEASDYALYRIGVVAGVQKNQAGKQNAMRALAAKFPYSVYAPDAMLEEGLSLLLQDKKDKAIACFDSLLAKYPASRAARTGMLQKGTAYMNIGDSQKGIAAYKQVVATYPGTDEAKTAIEDLKNFYVQSADIDSFTKYIKEVRIDNNYNTSELDSLTFLAAENEFLRTADEKSIKRLEDYANNYPKGAFITNAEYYLGEYFFDKENFDKSRKYLQPVCKSANPVRLADALLMLAITEERSGNYDTAYKLYEELAERGENAESRIKGKSGKLRMSSKLKRYSDAIAEATDLLKTDIPPEIETEALFLRGEAYFNSNKKRESIADWEKVASEPRSEYGATASFRLASQLFDEKDINGAEKIINNLLAAGSSHKYWVARGIILLSDISAYNGDIFKAKQYLESLSENYTGNDDVKKIINERLKKYRQ